MCQLLVQRASVAKCGPTDIFRTHFHCRAKITHRFICIKFSFDDLSLSPLKHITFEPWESKDYLALVPFSKLSSIARQL